MRYRYREQSVVTPSHVNHGYMGRDGKGSEQPLGWDDGEFITTLADAQKWCEDNNRPTINGGRYWIYSIAATERPIQLKWEFE